MTTAAAPRRALLDGQGAIAGVAPWPRWWTLGLPALAALALYGQLFPGLIREWTEFPNLSHGFAIPFIAAYLLWARRDRLRTAPVAPSLWGLPVLVVGLAGLVIGVNGHESFLARLSLPVTLLGLALFLAGPVVTRRAWIGVAYLLFMIPLPWTTVKLITYRSRLLDAAISTEALGWLGVPVHRDGFMLHLPNMSLEVADACSSIPALAALVSLGVAYASVARRPLALQLTLIAATIPLAVTANIIRITSTAAAVYYLGPWTLQSFYHAFNGTVNFLLTFLLLLALDSLLARWHGGPAR
jgi:exosortase